MVTGWLIPRARRTALWWSSGLAHHGVQHRHAPAAPYAEPAIDVAQHIGRVAEDIPLRGHVVLEGVVEQEGGPVKAHELHHHRVAALEVAPFLVLIVFGLAVGLDAAVEVEVEVAVWLCVTTTASADPPVAATA